MNTNLKAMVNDSLTYTFSDTELSNSDIINSELNQFHVIHNNQSYQIEIISEDFESKKYTLKVNNTVYTVGLEDELDTLIKEMGFSLKSAKQVDEIKAPMPGLILSINVAVGDTVAENDSLLVLEAMKMENVIASPRSGVIKSVEISNGQAVDKNAVLITFE